MSTGPSAYGHISQRRCDLVSGIDKLVVLIRTNKTLV